MPRTIKVPESVAELLQDPQRVRDALLLLNALSQLEVHLVPPGSSPALSPGNKIIKGDPPALILPLPLQFRSAIADSTATAASVSAQLNLLLAELRAVRQLPT